jgi:hypothetical protein
MASLHITGEGALRVRYVGAVLVPLQACLFECSDGSCPASIREKLHYTAINGTYRTFDESDYPAGSIKRIRVESFMVRVCRLASLRPFAASGALSVSSTCAEKVLTSIGKLCLAYLEDLDESIS